jgi:hypothetical protein
VKVSLGDCCFPALAGTAVAALAALVEAEAEAEFASLGLPLVADMEG